MAQATQLQQRGDYAAAETLFRRILHQDPQHSGAVHFLGLLAHQTGQSERAIELMQKSLSLEPHNSGFLSNLGGVLLACGKPQDASEYFRKALEINPSNAEAWQNLGSALDAGGLTMDAIKCWHQALAINPRLFDVYLQLADAFIKFGWREEAIATYNDALTVRPENPEVLARCGALLAEQGQIEKGMDFIDQAIARQPDLPLAHFNKGVLCEQVGDFPHARTELRKAIELDKEFYQAYVMLAGISHLAKDDPLVQKLEAACKEKHGKETGRLINVNFALAKVLHDNKQYDQAIEHYNEGNRLWRRNFSYSTQAQTRHFERIKSVFDQQFLQRNSNNISQLPIFIVGMPRSGTTLLEQTLARHPQIHGGGELTILHNELRYQFGPPQNHEKMFTGIATLSDNELGALADICAHKMQALAPHARRVIDKMPSNFAYLGLLHVLFPNACFIHCRRDPMDTCFSCYTTLFSQNHEYTYDLTELGEFYNLYEDMMQYWRESLPKERILEVQYEDVVTNTESTLRQIVEHCHLPWDNELLNAPDAKNVVRTASVYQVRQPIHRNSVGRWRHYEAHLGPLKAALQSRQPN